MKTYERDAVVEVIEQLVAELHPDNVPSEIDVEGALKILNAEEEEKDAGEEKAADVALEDVKGDVA